MMTEMRPCSLLQHHFAPLARPTVSPFRKDDDISIEHKQAGCMDWQRLMREVHHCRGGEGADNHIAR